jgi:hypothetical protein
MFKYDRPSVSDAERWGGPTTSTSDDKQEEDKSPFSTTEQQVRGTVGNSQGSVHTLTHGILGYHKLCARCAKTVTVERNSSRLDIGCRLKEQHHNEGKQFLNTSSLQANLDPT